MNRFTYVTSVSPGYCFALNCNLNTNKYYGTNADYVVVYSHMDNDYEKKWMETVSKSYPFKITWIPMSSENSTCFHSTKYAVAQSLAEEYDAICLIDSDLFICCDTKEYFERAAKENVMITATHMWSGGVVTNMPFGRPEEVNDRGVCQLADFPVFINPKFALPLMKQWKENTEDGKPGSEWQHPLVSFNRAICKFLKLEQIIPLGGEQWVCDQNYWDYDYSVVYDENSRMVMTSNVYGPGTRVYAIHNKNWKPGRCNGEWLAHRHVPENDYDMNFRLDRGERNFNVIKDMMAMFNDMTPETRRDDYLKEKIDRRSYLKQWNKDFAEGKIIV